MRLKYVILLLGFLCLFNITSEARDSSLVEDSRSAIMEATRFMVDTVSTNGGYVWSYLPDLSRRWGEMEAYETMIWVQGPGTVDMGHLFLDAYEVTGDEYYYRAAEKAAKALIWGQGDAGGWNYMIDFAGDRSMKKWYNTIGKNGWRLEEFHHYYGNSTFDDNVTSGAARFLLRIYIEKLDPKYKPALENAINFVIKSQYPLGGWPQRYPLSEEYSKDGLPDYTSYFTINDEVVWGNIQFLIQCYLTLGQERFLEPIRRGMQFYLITQQGNGAWGQQYNMQLEPVGARTYEPPALLPSTTYTNTMIMLKFYEYTRDRKFLARIPDAVEWLEKTKLPTDETEGGRYTHPTFIEPGTNTPIYVHRKGSNVKYGSYYYDYSNQNLLAHYYGKRDINLEQLKYEYQRLKDLSPEEAIEGSPLKVEKFQGNGTPQDYYDLHHFSSDVPSEQEVREIIDSLDKQNRWLTGGRVMTSHPYIGDGQKNEQTMKYSSTHVGDMTDTSPYPDTSNQKYISTRMYVRNMTLLINYLRKQGN